ncbi:MAG: DNA-binding domain-containing protein [Alphaproteobacteria bacterium]
MSLSQFQQQFKGLLFQEKETKDSDREDIILSHSLQVYQNNLYQSLYRTLSVKFRMTSLWLGNDVFFDLAKEYIFTVPQRSPYLCEYGDKFPLLINDPLAQSLASLEWEMNLSSMHYKNLKGLEWDDVLPVPRVSLAKFVFVLHPSVRLYKSNYCLQTLWNTIESKETRSILPSPALCYFLVSSEENKNFFFRISTDEYKILDGVQRGFSLEALHQMGWDNSFWEKFLGKFMSYFVEIQNKTF